MKGTIGGDPISVPYASIGQRIRSARKAQSFTQEQLAEMMNISVAYYGRLERGEKEINLDRLNEISQLLHVPVSQLWIDDTPAAAPASSASVFLEQMILYSQQCSEPTLRRMLAVCAALSKEDGEMQS